LTSDYTEAVRGIDECLELIETMFTEGEGQGNDKFTKSLVSVSLAQVSSQNKMKISR
jgi:hypothetical protein